MFLEQAVSTVLQMISTSVGGIAAQVDTDTLPKGPDKITQLIERVNQIPGVGWGLAVFAVLTLAVAAVAKLTGNLDSILSFFGKYFSKAEAELTEQELSFLRQQLLKQMKTDVAQRLEDSLHNLVRVDLEQEEQRRQIGRREDILVKAEPKQTWRFKNFISRKLTIFKNNSTIESIAPAEKTYSIFHRPDIGERLLILGEPGAGKTTELLTVAHRLIKEAIDDDDKPIPILFELSNWTLSTPILMWLGKQLRQTYGVSKKLAEPLVRQWLQQAQLLLLLDGLDELGQRNQVACIEALEDFLAQHPALSALICCRREEYEQGGQQLKQLRGAIYLQAVAPEQVQQYLKDLGREKLWNDIQSQSELLKLAQSPLFLTLLVVAYQEQSIRDREALFNAYIQKQLHEPSHQGAYKPGKGITPEKTLRYLGWLSSQLKQKQETDFLIENLQPDWLTTRRQERIYRLVVGLFIGLLFCLGDEIRDGLLIGLLSVPNGGLITGLRSLILHHERKIVPQEQLKWIPHKGLRGGLRSGLWGGLTVGLILGLWEGMRKGPFFGLATGLFLGLLSGLIVALLGGLFFGLSDETVKRKQVSNQGIKKTIQHGILNGLLGGLSFSLVFGLLGVLMFGDVLFVGLLEGITRGLEEGLFFGLRTGLIFGLFSGLIGGLEAAFQHLSLRIVLAKSGHSPWNYALFLEHAAQHRFIQRTGGRYRFIHNLLREHFAQMTPQQRAVLAQPPKNNGTRSSRQL